MPPALPRGLCDMNTRERLATGRRRRTQHQIQGSKNKVTKLGSWKLFQWAVILNPLVKPIAHRV
eukprot:7214375-Pyramimonas_sp.AAC.1